MIKVLIIKTSSMGDIAHTFPAIYELKKNIKNIEIDWVVEESFVDVVKLNKHVNNIITVNTRRWRKNWFRNIGNVFKFIKKLRAKKYDYVIDAQGLHKSLIITRLSKVNNKNKFGYDKNSIRGKYISWLYYNQISVSKEQHAIYRIQELFGKVFDYKFIKKESPDYGIESEKFINKKTIMFISNTTWETKKWPINNWIELGKLFSKNNYKIIINSGNDFEYKDACNIKEHLLNITNVEILKNESLDEKIEIIKKCDYVFSVDTGLAHVSALLGKNTIAIYGATSPKLTGIKGKNCTILYAKYNCSPCLKKKCRFENNVNYKICYSNSADLIKNINLAFVNTSIANKSNST